MQPAALPLWQGPSKLRFTVARSGLHAPLITAPCHPCPYVQAGQAQWNDAATPTSLTPDKTMTYQLLPTAVRTLRGYMIGAMMDENTFNASAAVAPVWAAAQWASCGVMVSLGLGVGCGISCQLDCRVCCDVAGSSAALWPPQTRWPPSPPTHPPTYPPPTGTTH